MIRAVSTSSRYDEVPGQPWDAATTRHLRELFTRLPALAGFRLRSDLTVADVSIVGSPDCTSIRRLQVRLMQALVELAECDSEAMVRMRGRTFARCRH
jgi:hypothetical protein